MKTLKWITSLLFVFLQLPIWWFLMYTVLKAVNADRLVWFLFYAYIPIGVVVSILGLIINNAEEKK